MFNNKTKDFPKLKKGTRVKSVLNKFTNSKKIFEVNK